MFADYRNEVTADLDFGLYLALLNNLKQLGTQTITFTGGGEPTLHPLFDKAVVVARKMGFRLGLITNGILLNKWANLKDHFEFIRVSLDAGSETIYRQLKHTDYFSQVISNVKLLSATNTVTLGLSYVVCDENKCDVEKAKKLADSTGASYLQFKPVYGTILDVKEDAILTQRYQVEPELPCHLAGMVGVVGADGDVFFCCQKRGVREFTLGNLREKSFEELWKLRSHWRINQNDCVTCRYQNYVNFLKNGGELNNHQGFL